MILLSVENNWYFFLIFVGGFLAITGIVLFKEARRDNEEILKLNLLVVLRNILLNQVGFYIFYLLVTFTVDIIGYERFYWTQIWAGIEFSFVTKRGLLTGLSLIITMTATSIPVIGTVQTYRNILDYCFTVFIIHFIIVSIVEMQFPAYGAWWASIGVGLLFFMLLAERLSYRLEIMTYQSSLQGTKSIPKTSKNQDPNLPELDSDGYLTSDSSYLESQPKCEEFNIGEKKDKSGDEGSANEKDSNSKEGKNKTQSNSPDSSSISSKDNIQEEEKKSGLINQMDENNEELRRTKFGGKLSGGSGISITSQIKNSHQQIKDEDTGKKDSLKAAKKRETLKEVASIDSVELEEVKESPPYKPKPLAELSESDDAWKKASTESC